MGTGRARKRACKPRPHIFNEEQPQSQKDLHTRIERTLQGDPFEIGYAHEQLGVVLASSGPLREGLKHMHIALTIYEQSELLARNGTGV